MRNKDVVIEVMTGTGRVLESTTLFELFDAVGFSTSEAVQASENNGLCIRVRSPGPLIDVEQPGSILDAVNEGKPANLND